MPAMSLRPNDARAVKPDDALLLRGGAIQHCVRGMRGGRSFDGRDWVADEVAVALEFNGISHAVMLATPLDLEDFALGFSLSEGILAHRAELYDVEQVESELGITLRLEVAGAAFARLKDRRRSMAGRTGCGLCGAESLSHVTRVLPPLPDGVPLHCRRLHGPCVSSPLANPATCYGRRSRSSVVLTKRRDQPAARGRRSPQCPGQAHRQHGCHAPR